MKKAHCTAIVLAAGQGRRMGTKIHKQYLLLDGRPILYYPLKEFQDSEIIDEIYLITGAGEEEYCRQTIVEKYNITKVTRILAGGAERYHSVWSGLQELNDEGYVFIHDGARPFVDAHIIERAFDSVCKDKACVAGMPVKDTIKIVDKNDFVKNTPDRKGLWMIQTPQVFENRLIKGAYSMLMRESYTNVTDDAMVVEQMLGFPIKLVRGSYENIKITTPEDLEMAEVFLKRRT
ncbi:MAG: 2-C-methyl-D-erythritol 4-phosphate cytidylyltransferase [Muricomes sp.]